MPDAMTQPEAEGCWNRIYAHTESLKAELLDLYERQGWLALGFKNYLTMVSAKLPGKSQSYYYYLLDSARTERGLLSAPDIEPEFSKILESLPQSHLNTLALLPDTTSRKAALELAYATAPEIIASGKPTNTLMQEAVNVVREVLDHEGNVELDEGIYAAQAKLVLRHHERVQEHVDAAIVRTSQNGRGRKTASIPVVNLAHARIVSVFPKANQVTIQFENLDDAEKMQQCYYLKQGSDLIVTMVRLEKKVVCALPE